jgi:hypothetical protein
MLPESRQAVQRRLSRLLLNNSHSRCAIDLGGNARTAVALGHGEIVAGLQVHPEPGAGAEMAGEAEAVSALIARLPFRIDVIRPEGTRSARASGLADMPRVASSRFKMRPGWIETIGDHPSW